MMRCGMHRNKIIDFSFCRSRCKQPALQNDTTLLCAAEVARTTWTDNIQTGLSSQALVFYYIRHLDR